MDNNKTWNERIIANVIERLDLVEWLKQEMIDDMEVELDEDDEGHRGYVWVDKGYNHESRVDEIAEKLIDQNTMDEKFDDPFIQNILTCATGIMAEKILDEIYDKAFDQALDELPNPNERDD